MRHLVGSLASTDQALNKLEKMAVDHDALAVGKPQPNSL
eukprot:CAMPEP_0179142988 /NCGR_PEP_ID=MMETSP0796-20121207/68729_1 /TAXON_ID=73915 /ORGANISM="Pyrodinium bahamense, Strain pbaha01" /LENGTH=38 /DNA_ID= /DNA_START= /DNA_END= /DNA_ORIENTATION=